MPETTDTAYGRESERLRSAARWIAAALAGTGAILAAGLELTHLGQLWDLNKPRLAIAVSALVVGVGAFGIMLTTTATVFTSRWLSLEDLVDQAFQGDLPSGRPTHTTFGRLLHPHTLHRDRQRRRGQTERETVLADIDRLSPALFAEVAPTTATLHETLARVSQEHRSLFPTHQGPDTAATTKVAVARSAATRTIDFANYSLTVLQFSRAKKVLLIGSTIAIAATITFAIAANPTTPISTP